MLDSKCTRAYVGVTNHKEAYVIIFVSTINGMVHRYKGGPTMDCKVEEDNTLTIFETYNDGSVSVYGQYNPNLWAMWQAFDEETNYGIQLEGLKDGDEDNEEAGKKRWLDS